MCCGRTGLRASFESEQQGMDVTEHGGHAYNFFAGDWETLQLERQDSLRKRQPERVGNGQVAVPLDDETGL